MLLLPPRADEAVELPQGGEVVFGGEVFGTSWQVRAIASTPQTPDCAAAWTARLRAASEDVLALVDRQMSPWIATSSSNAYNRLPPGSAMVLPEPMRSLVRDAISLRDLTGGLFDPFVGAATDLWGFGPSPFDPTVRDSERSMALRLRRASAAPAFAGPALPRSDHFSLDLCGIAKGLAVDLVAAGLADDPQVGAVLVEIGGELKGFGLKSDAMPWWVDLDWSSYGATPPMRLALHGWACASSGVAERNFTKGERLYSHTIDPRTGEPIENDLAGVSVLDRECWRADALATALLVAGSRQGAEMAERLAIPCLLVGTDGEIAHLSAALQEWRDDD
ncbi:FAD:protein FMN transferase [Aurantiacibacter flavus]|uniref:FAD:protein FMN transferase n=1 Tax=Aurantiacibacter flavus TaxID=3145232 RepID=A0ABV0CY78_9SPHN